MKSSMLNDDAKVGLVLNALLGFYDDDMELEEAAKAWKQALSKNKRKADNVIKTVNTYESQEASIELPKELSERIANVSRSQSPSTTPPRRTQEDIEAEQRASQWRGRARSPARPPPKRTMTVQEELRATLRGRKID